LKNGKKDLLLYAVTDRSWLEGRSLTLQTEEAIRAGATFIQLREKALGYEAFLAQAREVRALASRYLIPFVINDNIEVALACGADGVHVGQKDRPADETRRLLGPGKILGVSVQTVSQAMAAQESGADYLGVGAVFSTATKQDAAEVTFETLRAICGAVRIPVVAIGGIQKDNVMKLAGSGIAGVAVVSAIFAQPDIRLATAEMRQLAEFAVYGAVG
jgi:thiamine-phosphate pyrophosphorylase